MVKSYCVYLVIIDELLGKVLIHRYLALFFAIVFQVVVLTEEGGTGGTQ